MLDRTEAASLLSPLAATTFDAYARARRDSDLIRSPFADQRASLEPSALALCDGINFWSYWSSYLARGYENLPSVRRAGSHPLEHVWVVAERFQLRLKSDVHALDPVQTALPGLARELGGVVALSAPVTEDTPFFVGMGRRKVAWRIAVPALLSVEATPLQRERPKVSLRLGRPSEDLKIAS